MRVKFAELVRHNRPDLHLHAFGMVNGDVHELHYLDGLVNSIDSSAPVWRGWQGYSITEPLDRKQWDEKGGAVDFNRAYDPVTKGLDPLILDNLEACGVRTSQAR
jgi:hypothetical protein